MESDVIERVRSEVRRGLESQQRVVLAVSGGIDSMVLLDAAVAEIPLARITVATFDHGTGETASRAARLVARRCAQVGIPCEHGFESLADAPEATLRDARWRFLNAVAATVNAVVVTAHTTDDQIETVLMRTMRGAGARGLAGLAAESRVVRPLLGIRRRDVACYARERMLEWVEDPSNASMRFFRNRARHQLLPALRTTAPWIDEYLLGVGAKAAAWRREVDAFIDAELDVRVLKTGGLDVRARSVSGYSIFELRELLPAIVARAGVVLDRRGIVRLAEFARHSRIGARVQLSGDWEVVRSRDTLQLRASNEMSPTPQVLALSHATTWSSWRFSPVPAERVSNAWGARLPAGRALTVRSWRAGDVVTSGAARARRKVKDLLSKAGITGYDRGNWPVVLAGDDIVWIPGVRVSEVAPDSTVQPELSFVCEYISR